MAEVVALEGSETQFRFYPGDISIDVPPGQSFESGREFKAILLQADGCDPKLEVIDAVH